MSAHDGTVDHRVFIVGVSRQAGKNPLPDATFCPTGMPFVNIQRVTKAFRQIPLRNASTVTIQHGINK
jgi:hypothetical protein